MPCKAMLSAEPLESSLLSESESCLPHFRGQRRALLFAHALAISLAHHHADQAAFHHKLRVHPGMRSHFK